MNKDEIRGEIERLRREKEGIETRLVWLRDELEALHCPRCGAKAQVKAQVQKLFAVGRHWDFARCTGDDAHLFAVPCE